MSGESEVSTKLQMQAHVLDNQLEWTSTHDYAKTHNLGLLFGLAVEEAAKVHAENPREFISNYLWGKRPTLRAIDRSRTSLGNPFEVSAWWG